jgi:hypothetical protein
MGTPRNRIKGNENVDLSKPANNNVMLGAGPLLDFAYKKRKRQKTMNKYVL